MSDASSNSSSNDHPSFNKKAAYTTTNIKIDFISSILDNDCSNMIDKNKWKCI